MTEPASVVSDGMVKVAWVTVMGDPARPANTELDAGTVLDLSCYLTDSGWAPNLSEDTVTDPRLCSTETFTRPGRSQTTIPLVYVYNPDSPADDEARITLTNRATGYLVARWGVDVDTPFNAGDIVDVYPVQLGKPNKQAATANTPLTIMQTAYVRSPGSQIDVVVSGS